MALNELVAATVAFVAALLPEEEAFELFFFLTAFKFQPRLKRQSGGHSRSKQAGSGQAGKQSLKASTHGSSRAQPA